MRKQDLMRILDKVGNDNTEVLIRFTSEEDNEDEDEPYIDISEIEEAELEDGEKVISLVVSFDYEEEEATDEDDDDE